MRAVLRVAAAGRGNAAIVGIVITLSIVPSSRQSGIHAGIRWSVELSAVLRRAMVCMVMCAAIIVVAMVRASESGECARAVLLMCASAARDAHGALASSVAQVAIARVSIPFVLVNGLLFRCMYVSDSNSSNICPNALSPQITARDGLLAGPALNSARMATFSTRW